MAFWNNKSKEDPGKKLKKLRKYCQQVLGLSREDAEKKAQELFERENKLKPNQKTFTVFLLIILCSLWGMSSLPASPVLPTAVTASATRATALTDRAGFIELEPIDFYFHFNGYFSRLDLTSSRARFWYTFQAADEDPAGKPLFIFFNGGPGGATSSGLLSLYTSQWTLDNTKENGGDEFIPNPVPWTQLGNLLYIDARETGFSYDMTENAEDITIRLKEFDAQNYNSYIDAADFIRVLLRFFEQYPQLRNNRIIIVGESYGGIRALVMLYMLLNYHHFGDGSEPYQDETLVTEIQQHYNQVFPDYRDQEVPPAIIAGQFSHQVLIQPAITTYYQEIVAGEILEQEGSLIYQVAQETGVPYIPCRLQNDPYCNPMDNIFTYLTDYAERDYYICSKPRDWLWGFFDTAAQLLQYTEILSQVCGVDVTKISSLAAAARADAYRMILIDPNLMKSSAFYKLPLLCQYELKSRARVRTRENITTTALTPLAQTFGTLQPWDCYFLDLNSYASSAHHNNIAIARGYFTNFRYAETYGWMFLKNLAYVKTFITNAQYDVVIYGPALPGALEMHSSIVSRAQHLTTPQPGKERPGRIIVTYQNNAFADIPGLQSRVIRFPYYAGSCHAVSLTNPIELYTDVAQWLGEK